VEEEEHPIPWREDLDLSGDCLDEGRKLGGGDGLLDVFIEEAALEMNEVDLEMNGADLEMNGADLKMNGADLVVNGADLEMNEADLELNEEDLEMNEVDSEMNGEDQAAVAGCADLVIRVVLELTEADMMTDVETLANI